MPDSRTEILARIDATHHRAGPIPRDYARTRDLGDLVELAAERIADYRAAVHRTPAGGLIDKIRAILADRVAHHMLAPPGLPLDWRVDGITWLVDEPPLTIEQLDQAGGVLTGCALVIAETGTIVLNAGEDQGRRALTLVPDYHLCVVRADQIVGTVPEAIGKLDPTRPTTFVSGPSATSDIEFNRVEGVHGPRTLDVLIVT